VTRRGGGGAWKIGLAGLAMVVVIATVTRGAWLPWIAGGLVCAPADAAGDAIVVENFDTSYLLFERAAALQRRRPATRVVVPVSASTRDPGAANPVSKAVAELMARFAGLEHVSLVPVRQAEPYALNTAYQVRDFLTRERLGSAVVVTSGFRSRRSALVYGAVLAPAAIRVSCVPVFEGHTPDDWWRSWHGVEVVIEQFAKLQFYRFRVLPAVSGPSP
jgi:hypothetical protein